MSEEENKYTQDQSYNEKTVLHDWWKTVKSELGRLFSLAREHRDEIAAFPIRKMGETGAVINDTRERMYDENGKIIGGNRADGAYSLAGGTCTEALGAASVALGTHTVAAGENQLVSGKYNAEDADALQIVGNGTKASDGTVEYSNAYTLDKDGNGWFAGEVTVGAEKERLVTEQEVKNAIRNKPDIVTYYRTEESFDEFTTAGLHVVDYHKLLSNGGWGGPFRSWTVSQSIIYVFVSVKETNNIADCCGDYPKQIQQVCIGAENDRLKMRTGNKASEDAEVVWGEWVSLDNMFASVAEMETQLTTFATKEYVNEKQAEMETQLTTFAPKGYVNEKQAEIEVKIGELVTQARFEEKTGDMTYETELLKMQTDTMSREITELDGELKYVRAMAENQAETVPYDNTESGLEAENVQSAIDELTEKLGEIGNIAVESWADVQKIVRAGLAPKVFSVGDQFTVSKGDENLVFDIIGFDHDTPVDTQYTHSMTLQLHDCFPSLIPFDGVEAAWYIDEETYPNGLAAGTYCFTLPSGYDEEYGGGKSYSFTIAKAVPVGGQICFAWQYNKQASDTKITTYSTVGATAVLETVSVVEGEDGIAMPAISATAVTSNTNCVYCHRFGSNNWSQSGVRQWLNTDGDAGTWWEAKSVFDRPGNASVDGFLKGIDPAFLDVVGEVSKTTQKNISAGHGLETATERFFLLSKPEVYGGAERSEDGADGTVYEYYDAGHSDLSAPGEEVDTNRVKYRNGSAAYWLLRTPKSDSWFSVKSVYPKGYVNSNQSATGNGIAPACCIV